MEMMTTIARKTLTVEYKKMETIKIILVLGFTFDPRPEASNSVLFNRVKLLHQVASRMNVTDGPWANYLIFSGRGAVRAGFEKIDEEKLKQGRFEAVVMREHFEEIAREKDKKKGVKENLERLGNITFSEDLHSTITMENALFGFWHIIKILEQLPDGVHPKEIELTVVTSDFHVVRTSFLMKRVYSAVKKLDKFKDLHIPALESISFQIDKLTPPNLFQKRIFSKEAAHLLCEARNVDVDTTAFDQLGPLMKGSKGLGVVGFAELGMDNTRWEVLSGDINRARAIKLFDDVSNRWPAYCNDHGIEENALDLQAYLVKVLGIMIKDFDNTEFAII